MCRKRRRRRRSRSCAANARTSLCTALCGTKVRRATAWSRSRTQPMRRSVVCSLAAHERTLLEAQRPGVGLVHPFDDPLIWQGHATMIAELRRQLATPPDAIVLSVGGGGLLCGVLEGLHAVDDAWTGVPVVCAETTGTASFAAAVNAGHLVTLDKIDSIASTLGAKRSVRSFVSITFFLSFFGTFALTRRSVWHRRRSIGRSDIACSRALSATRRRSRVVATCSCNSALLSSRFGAVRHSVVRSRLTRAAAAARAISAELWRGSGRRRARCSAARQGARRCQRRSTRAQRSALNAFVAAAQVGRRHRLRRHRVSRCAAGLCAHRRRCDICADAAGAPTSTTLAESELFSKAVNLDELLLANLLVGEKLRNVLALIALQLNDLAELGIVDNGAVAAERLLKRPQDLVKVDLLRDAARRRERLAASALLDANVHEIGWRASATHQRIAANQKRRPRERTVLCAADGVVEVIVCKRICAMPSTKQ